MPPLNPLHQLLDQLTLPLPLHTTMSSSSSSSSSSTTFSDIPIKAFISFHSLERRLFLRMAFSLGVNASLAMEIIAFWMWLEEAGHPCIIRQLLDLPDQAIRAIAVEAKKCIANLPNPMDPSTFLKDIHVPFVAPDSPVSLNFVRAHKNQALRGVTATLNNVCHKIFDDLLPLMPPKPIENPNPNPNTSAFNTISGATQRHQHNMTIEPNMFNHMLANPNLRSGFGGVGSGGASMLSYQRGSMGLEQSNVITPVVAAQIWRPQEREVPRDERTLFVTFSNGYPLKEGDLHEFFSRHFGPIEMILMQQVIPGDEPLFARIVFYLQEALFLVLNGSEKVKFVIKGKHVWARRYIPKKKKRSN